MCDIIEVETDDNLQYVFISASSGAVQFKVKATNDAHIALTTNPYEEDIMTEVHIGGWDNTKSIVRRNRREPDKVKLETPNILNSNEYVGMWICWYNSRIAAGLEGSNSPFILYDDPTPHPIRYMAVRTGWGSCGSWKIEVSPVIPPVIRLKRLSDGDLHWVEMRTGDPLPIDALIAGFEGEPLYVARARHMGSLCPGKYVPSTQCAVVPFGHQAHTKMEFEILCGFNFTWLKTTGHAVPPNAFPGGQATETSNETTYIGRAFVEKHLIPGKIHLHYKTCYLPVGNEEIEITSYEVLVIPDKLHKQVHWKPTPVNTGHRIMSARRCGYRGVADRFYDE